MSDPIADVVVDRRRLADAVAELLDVLAIDVSLPTSTPQAARPALARLAVAEALAVHARDLATIEADRAAVAGADYPDVAAAVGLSRQGARHRWPELATARAAGAAAAGRPLPPYQLFLVPDEPGYWRLAGAGAPVAAHDGQADDTAAQAWATDLLAQGGIRVTGWTRPPGSSRAPYVATVARRRRSTP